MENDNEQSDLLESAKQKAAEIHLEGLRRRQLGETYNTPSTLYTGEEPEDVDAKADDAAVKYLTEQGYGGQDTTGITDTKEDTTEETTKESNNFHRDMKLDWNPAKWLYMTGMGALDVPFDVVGLIPGLGWVDDNWDDVTRFDNEGARKFRAAASIILPTIVTSGKYGKFVAAQKLPALTKAAMNVGGVGLINGAIASASDFGEDPDNRFLTSPQNFKRLQEWWPEIFGPQGRYPLAEDLMKVDGIDPELNRILIGLEETVFSGVGDIIGYGFNAAKPILWKVKPLNQQAEKIKKAIQLKYMEGDTKKVIADIDTALKSGVLDDNQVIEGVSKKAKLIDQITTQGSSEVTGNPAESIVRDRQRSRQAYKNQSAVKKLIENPWGKEFDPEITPKLASEQQLTGNAFIPGAAIQNTIDVTAQELGQHSRNAVPASPITPAARAKGTQLGNEFEIVTELTEKVRNFGEYTDFLNKFSEADRFKGTMKIYDKIMPFGTGTRLAKILSDPAYQSTTKLLDKAGKEVSVTHLSPDALSAAALAMSDLLDVYVGRETQATSARVMSTLGKEISAISSGSITFKGLMDQDIVYRNILDRVELLVTEYGKAKYVAGWTLENAAWWRRFYKGDPVGEVAKTVEDFQRKALKGHENFKNLRKSLEELHESGNKRVSQILKEAYDYSDGDINSILSLDAWTKQQINPGGLIHSDGRGMNLFAKGAWASVYNNVLSGLASLRAAVGNGFNIILKPLTTLSRAGMRSVMSGSSEPWERAIYLHGAMFETARRAMSDMTQRMGKVHSDPDFMMKVIRKDFVIEEDNAWKIIDDYSQEWEKNGDHWSSFVYGWAKVQRGVGRMKWMRTGMTAMAGVDAFTDTFMATFTSRVRAYDEVFSNPANRTLNKVEFEKQLVKAEKINYSNMFDKDGVLTEAAAKNASGEIALNLDDGASTWLNAQLSKWPVMKVFMMFPRTGLNQVKMALSYTPIAKIPGIKTKYARILQAGDDIELIKKALQEHNIDFDKTPNAMAIYKTLKDEYEGRILVGGATAIMGFWYAMSGNVRGNGPVNAKERQDLMKKGWRQYTVKIGDNWVSYKGIPMVEQMLAIVGDLAYYQTALGTNLTETYLSKIGWTISATYLNNTPLYGIEPIMAMINGDESAFKRIAVNIGRGAIPQSGAFGVVANAITQAQKDIHNDLLGYALNSLPLKPVLPNQIDHWTGEPVNEIDNPLLRILNAINPQKVSGGEEPWRLWLLNSGFDDIGFLRDYTAQEREVIGRYMGEDQLWKKIDKMRFVPKYNDQLNDLRELMRKPGVSTQEVMQYRKSLPVYKEIRKLLNNSLKRAKARIAMDPRYKHLNLERKGQESIKRFMELGQVEEAADQADKNKRINELLQLNK